MKSIVVLPMLAALAQAAAIEPRAVTCSTMLSTINSATNGLSKATTYCQAYLGLTPITRTSTITKGQVTQITERATTTTTLTTTPPTNTKTAKTKTTTWTTTTPGVSTNTEYVTSTAYIDNDGNTLAIMRRAVPTAGPDSELAKRATTASKPAFFNGLSKSDLKAACLCLNLVRPTITRKATVTSLATVTKSATYTKKVKAIAPTPLATTTNTQILTKVQTAKRPVVTATQVVYEDSTNCPPNTNTLFECPTGTGDDDLSGTDDGQLSCPIMASDNYWGSCEYWDDDGSPVGTTLQQDDGSDNPDTRDASYGDDDSDDCPSWADYSCSASNGSKRWFQENKLSPRSTGTKLTRKVRKLRPIPKGLKRGGHRKFH